MTTSTTPSDATQGDARKGPVVLMLAVFVVAAFLLRAWGLFGRGVLDFDETYYYMLGRNLVTGRGYVLNGLPHTAFPPLYPMLVGMASLFTASVPFATSIVSAVSGALLPLPVYFLTKDVYSRGAAVFASAAVAVWPALNFFSARYVSYGRRLYFGSEPLYVTLLACGMLFIWRFARSRRALPAALAGLFFGLASLVRSEGPVVFAFLFAWAALYLLVSKQLLKVRSIAALALVAAVMLATFSPFLIYVRNTTGQWTLGAKLTNNTRIRDTLWNWVRLHKESDFLQAHYRLNSENTQLEDPYWGVADYHREALKNTSGAGSGLALIRRADLRWLPFFVEIFFKGLVPLVAWYAWIFIAVSILSPPWGGLRRCWWGFCLANAAPMVLLAVSLYVLPRHELPLLPLLAVEFGRGVALVTSWTRRAAARFLCASGGLAAAIAVVPAVIVFAGLTIGSFAANALGNRPHSRDAALSGQPRDMAVAAWLKDTLPPGSTLMCNEPWLALYSGTRWRVCPISRPERILEYARNRKVDFAIIADYQLLGDQSERAVLLPYLMARLDGDRPVLVYDFRKLARP